MNDLRVSTDVDIDVANRDKILEHLEHIVARIDQETGKPKKHNTGIYFQNISRDPWTNMANMDHKLAAVNGYFKIDFLNVHFYENIHNEDHLLRLMNKEPDWDLFLDAEITDQLFHLNNYSHLLKKYKPKSIEQLAMILAIIRPSKAYLQDYSWKEIEKEVWVKNTEDKYHFKRGHAIAYGVAIVVNLNLLLEANFMKSLNLTS